MLHFPRRFTLLLLAASLAAAAHGQERLATVKVYTNPPGLGIRVDGQYFPNAAAFTWPAGSTHTLSVERSLDGVPPNTRQNFVGWVTTGDVPLQPNGPLVTITADPSLNVFRADFSTEYALDLRFFRCVDSGAACPSPGKVYADGAVYTHDARLWVSPGTVVPLQAVPEPGYVFVGWQTITGSSIQGFINTVRVDHPTVAIARFEPARTVRLDTSPAGLEVLVDRAPVTAPRTFEWGYETLHSVAPVSPQIDGNGRLWVFRSWSDGGAPVHAFRVQTASEPAQLTATYVPGARVTFMTSPPGLKVSIDGRDNWYGGYNFSWGIGETHRAEAPPEQTGADGRKYVFKGWSNGAPAAQDVVIGEGDTAGLRLTAVYEALGRLSVQASVPGLEVAVDGAPCATPCILERPAGTDIRIAAPSTVPEGDASRRVFQGWNDGAGAERTYTFSTDSTSLQAAYRLEHRLLASAEPAGGARWICEPASPDGFYDAQAQVAVRVETRPGFRFRRLEGDLSGSYTSGLLTMSVPRHVRAVFDRVPYIDPAGVRNAAGETPGGAVAPGSVISISGVHLAPDAQNGPESPLAQTLAGVTVRTGERLLPLFSVSPERIVAQLPSDIEPGGQTLAVKSGGQPEVKASFLVAPNAPGLFQSVTDTGNFAVAVHEDGSEISIDSPARRGETVTLYGTGFGPCDRQPPDGFAVPAAPVYSLLDPVEIVAGEVVSQPLWAGAAPGRVGVHAVKMQVSPDAPAGSLTVFVRVNGQESNAVQLPVE